ncbi:MAG: hypothetical protein KDB27_33020 [Planctomycetales bacterium]|nr:hypothetical protein [Planctomycetales bacterium]
MTENEQEQQPIPSQADLYEDLRRIGELEDQKANVQTEIDQLTERLTKAIPHLDKSSLLAQMLTATLKPKTSAPKRAPKTAKKAPRKK